MACWDDFTFYPLYVLNAFLLSPTHSTISAHFSYLDFFYRGTVWYRAEIMKNVALYFQPSPYFLLLNVNILLSTGLLKWSGIAQSV